MCGLIGHLPPPAPGAALEGLSGLVRAHSASEPAALSQGPGRTREPGQPSWEEGAGGGRGRRPTQGSRGGAAAGSSSHTPSASSFEKKKQFVTFPKGHSPPPGWAAWALPRGLGSSVSCRRGVGPRQVKGPGQGALEIGFSPGLRLRPSATSGTGLGWATVCSVGHAGGVGGQSADESSVGLPPPALLLAGLSGDFCHLGFLALGDMLTAATCSHLGVTET